MYRLLFLLLPSYLLAFGTDVSFGYDHFRSLPDGDWAGNTGCLIGFNTATECKGFKLQTGSSFGLYDWAGRGSAPSNKQRTLQQQLFSTVAVGKSYSCYNFALAYDWMWNKAFGVFGVQTSFSQLRMSTGYQLNRANEVGLWGTIDLNRSHRSSQNIPVTYRALAQVSAYWKHLFANCSEIMVWAGLPYKRSLSYSTGRAGKALFGARVAAPLCNALTFEGHGMYMIPHSADGALRQRNYAANLCLELKYHFGCERPFMPLADNSNFIADTNVTF